MLVLSRETGEEIVIGNEPTAVVIRVLRIRGNKVRLGIDAPRKVPVHRREVFDILLDPEVDDAA
jgi:carbon storage regulator